MPADIREYLIERFRADAITLRDRVRMLQASSARPGSKPVAGPDVALSAAMADACDHVVELATQLPERASLEDIVAALRSLLPTLTAHGSGAPASVPPAVRSVYAGAATRVVELIAAETREASEVGDQDEIDDTDDVEDEEDEYDDDDDEGAGEEDEGRK